MDATYEHHAFAKLMLKTMSHSYGILQTYLPFELTARFLTAFNVKNSKNCLSYAAVATKDAARQTAICNG